MSSTGPSIVTDGLILYYDINNPASFTSGSLTIRDLSGNGNNGTITSGTFMLTDNIPTMNISGVAGNILVSSSIVIDNSSSWYVEVISYVENPPTVGGILPITQFSSTGFIKFESAGVLFGQTNLTASLFISPMGNGIAVRSGSFNIAGANTTSSRTYGVINGVQSTNTSSLSGSLGINRFFQAQTGVSSTRWVGAKVYNKFLTQEEIQQNYEAFKARYGLTT